MPKADPNLVTELEALVDTLKEQLDTATTMPPDQVRKELAEMGIDTTRAHQRLNEMIKHIKKPAGMGHVGRSFTAHGRVFSLAADDSIPEPQLAKEGLFSLGVVSVDNTTCELLTDGGRVFLRLPPGERHTQVHFDEKIVPLEIMPDGSAMLVDFGRAKVVTFLDRMMKEPGRHSVRWGINQENCGK